METNAVSRRRSLRWSRRVPAKYRFALADERDDVQIRDVIRKTPMEGSFRLTFRKDPNFFSAERIGARDLQVIVGRNTESGRIVGFGSRSVRRVFINGGASDAGYLSSLRALPEVRGGTLLSRAYKLLYELHQDGRVPFYATTILNDNIPAKNILGSGRAGLPVYRDMGTLNTYVVSVSGRVFPSHLERLCVTNRSGKSLAHIVDYIHGKNAGRQFAPVIREGDFGGSGIFPGLRSEHFYLALDGDSIVGAAALWDQSQMKQTVVEGYGVPIRALRPFYNCWARLAGAVKIPKTGEELKYAYVSFTAADSPDIFSAILSRIIGDPLCAQYSFLVAGCNKEDPLAEAFKRFRHRVLKSTMYCVYWEDGRLAVEALDGRRVHLEVALL